MTVPNLSYLTNLKELLLKDVQHPTGGLLNLETQKAPDIGWITRLTSLETLELSLSNVTTLPGNVSALTQLRELSLSYMKELDLTQLPSSPSLWTLRLKHCKIQEPKFSSLICLSELELDNCNLAEIDSLEDLGRLEVLTIFDCRNITDVNELKNLPRLKKVKVFPSDPASLSELCERGCEVDLCG
ncbi:hypothetical protein ACJRO7_015371 [Eucalyptus globulus]|uniref:Uncharacterized protein n=1 Tax=Eucalyptus globulus TaxID=34317 RepID=A0ABD3L4B4_EUCGL